MCANSNKKICIIAYPVGNAFSIPLSNLCSILSSFKNIYVVAGVVSSSIEIVKSPKIHITKIIMRNSKNPIIRILNYISLQINISLIIMMISKKTGLYIFFMESGSILPMLVAKVLRKKIFWFLPSSMETIILYKGGKLNYCLVPLQNFSYFFADKIILYSRSLVKAWHLEKYENKIIFAWGNIMDFDKFKISKPYVHRKNIVGYIGRITEEKGILNFVLAIPLVLKKRADVLFLIGGDGPLKKKVEQMLNEQNLRSNVQLTGWIPHDQLPIYFNELKLIVLPSYTEGLPNILLEAIACGTPVLATAVGAIPDFIHDGETGLLIQDNSPQTIANKIIEALGKDLTPLIHNSNLLLSNEFNQDHIVKKWQTIIFETQYNDH